MLKVDLKTENKSFESENLKNSINKSGVFHKVMNKVFFIVYIL